MHWGLGAKSGFGPVTNATGGGLVRHGLPDLRAGVSHTPTLALALSASCLPPLHANRSLLARHTASTSSSSSSSTRMHHAHRTAANP